MASLDHRLFCTLSKYCPFRSIWKLSSALCLIHDIPDNDICGRLIVINLSWTLRPCTKQRNISCKHLRTKVHPPFYPTQKPMKPRPQSPSYMLTVCPWVTSFLMSMSIYIMTLQHVWYIWPVCEVTVFSYTVVVVEMQTDREEEKQKCVFFVVVVVALTANKLLCCSVVTSPSTEFRPCEPLTSDFHSNTGRKRCPTNTFSVILGVLAPLHFNVTRSRFALQLCLLTSQTQTDEAPYCDWVSSCVGTEVVDVDFPHNTELRFAKGVAFNASNTDLNSAESSAFVLSFRAATMRPFADLIS